MTSSTEELDLLERVFLRVGAAESDEQLELTIGRFLIPVLLKLSSPTDGVRKKVMELLVHINKRIKRRPRLQLPVEALLTQFMDPEANSFLVNFSILYIKIGYPRLPPQKQVDLVPMLLNATSGKQKIHQDSLLLLLTLIVGRIKLPPDTQRRREMFKMDEQPELIKSLASFMLDVLLLPYGHTSPLFDPMTGVLIPRFQPPPGMSEYGYKRVASGDPPLEAERLEEAKLGILNFLSTGILSNEDMICHLIIASADPRFTVADFAENELRKIYGLVNWANTTVASRLFLIYLGTPDVPPGRQNPIPPANRVFPGDIRLRLRILPYLSRLEDEALLYPATVHVVFNSIYDRCTNPKLQLRALNFALGIVKRANEEIINRMAGMLYTGLLKLVWNTEQFSQIRVAGYTIIAQIVKRLPRIISKNLIELQVFFESLSCEQPDVRMAVRDALLVMIDAFQLFMRGHDIDDDNDGDNGGDDNEERPKDPKDNPDDGDKRRHELANRDLMMINFLASQVESRDPLVRSVAGKYLAALFDYGHIHSRYLLLLLAGDEDSEVSAFAINSLYLEIEIDDKVDGYIPFPDFVSMAEFVREKAAARMQEEEKRVIIKGIQSPFNEETCKEILIYLRLCMARSSSVNIANKVFISHPSAPSPYIRQYILETHETNPSVFKDYLNTVELLLPADCEIPIGCLVEVVGTCPELFATRFTFKFEQFMDLMSHTKESVRYDVAILLSVLMVSTMGEEALNEKIRVFLNKLDDKSIEIQHAAILVLGHVVQWKLTQLIGNNEEYKPKLWPLHKEITLKIAKYLESPYSILVSATCTALGLIMKTAPLPLPDEAKVGLSKQLVMRKFLKIISTARWTSQIKEKAIVACGMMCVGENFRFAKELLESFLTISKQLKEIDAHFSIGEAIILCLEGTSSSEKRNMWRMKESDYVKPPMPQNNVDLLNIFLEKLFHNISVPHPNMRQGIAIYLLSITKMLYPHAAIKEKLPAIQDAFTELLSESNDLVQDIASKGLSLVYEYTSPENRKEVVCILIDQLLSGKRSRQYITKETRSGQTCMLATVPVGGNLPLYKELCCIVLELNQPHLIYSFMHLANRNFLWSSRKGLTFGFNTITLKAESELNPYLARLIPRLYRYQYDPTPKIQQSMKNVWYSLVPEPYRTVPEYMNPILDELINNLASNQWRVRISCALALEDFFKGTRSIEDAMDRLPAMMRSLFRIMDDPHEGTRNAAEKACKTLADICIHLCDITLGRVNEELLKVVLPIFLRGITCSSSKVRKLSLLTVSQFVHAAGTFLKPDLPEIIATLLEAAGELEAVGLSYLSAQYGARIRTQDMIDTVRANITRSHFTTQTVIKCIHYVELEMMDVLVPRTIEIMKSVKLGSKIAAGHLIVLLAHQLGQSMEKYTGKFLSALMSGLSDKNPAVRRTYASAIGQIIHVAKPSSLDRLFKKLFKWFFEKEDPKVKKAIGFLLQSAGQYNGNVLRDYYPVAIPIVFFGLHEEKIQDEDDKDELVWEDVWNDVALGYEISIRQQIDQILSCVELTLTSPLWATKAQAGKCIQTLAAKAGETIDNASLEKLIRITLRALEGRTFTGKEHIVKGLAKLCVKSGYRVKRMPDMPKIVLEAILRECGKKDVVYKRNAVEALGSVLETFGDMEKFQKVYEFFLATIEKFDEESDEGEDLEDINFRKNEENYTIGILYISLVKSLPRNKEIQLRYQNDVINDCKKILERSPRDLQVSILVALHCYIQKLHFFNSESKLTKEDEKYLNDFLPKLCSILNYSLVIKRHLSLRKEALNILTTLGNKFVSMERDEELKYLKESLEDTMTEVAKDFSPEVSRRLKDLDKIYERLLMNQNEPNQEAPIQETPNQENPNQDTQNQEALNQEGTNQETPNQEALNQEPPK